WAEEIVYDDINDYTGYLSSFYNSLYRSLDYDDGNLRIYGSAVWNLFLTERLGASVVVDNWWQMEVSGEYTAMAAVLTTYGTSLADEYHEFCVWNFFTNSRNDGTHYEEGTNFPLATMQRTFGMYPLVGVGPYTATRPDHMGANYIRLSNPGNTWTGLYLAYDGPPTYELAHYADVCVREDQIGIGHTSHVGEIAMNPWGNGDITVEDWDIMDYATLIVTNACTTTDDMDYLFDAEQIDTGVDIDGHVFAMKPASPNPFTVETAISYTVPNGGGAVEMTIYDVNGREVRTLVNERMTPGDRLTHWDGLDNAGEKVGSGVYFARLNVDGLTACGKLVILK
ncbi:T9SS type A sorting domain-containing protein, partial [bacterium]|nr:T9SS type A sorting domain-containing protein [bacterium]